MLLATVPHLPTSPPERNAGGQAALPVAFLAVALLASLALVAHWGSAALSSSRAQSVADAAALATLTGADPTQLARGILPDASVARSIAHSEGATLTSFDVQFGQGSVEATVGVILDDQQATATASIGFTPPITN